MSITIVPPWREVKVVVCKIIHPANATIYV
jgi:hypothetical protein